MGNSFKLTNGKVIEGIQVSDVKDLPSDEELHAAGYIKHTVSGMLRNGKQNTTSYYVSEMSDYVYACVYYVSFEKYVPLIISKRFYEELELSCKCVYFKTASSNNSRYVPSTSIGSNLYADRMTSLPLHKADYRDSEVDHVNTSLNVITENSLRPCTHLENNRNKPGLGTIEEVGKGDAGFVLTLSEPESFMTPENISAITDMGFSIKKSGRCYKVCMNATNKYDLLVALSDYKKKLYGEFNYSPLKDMCGHIDLMIKLLITKEMTQDDVNRVMLISLAGDAKTIVRYGLIPEYEKYKIAYDHGVSLANGDFVSAGKITM